MHQREIGADGSPEVIGLPDVPHAVPVPIRQYCERTLLPDFGPGLKRRARAGQRRVVTATRRVRWFVRW